MTSLPTRPRGSTLVAVSTTGLLLALALCGGFALVERAAGEVRRAGSRDLVAALGLTDVTLFGEARYTRHRSLADLASAFQDGPATLDHFPSGSLVTPPRGFGAGRLEIGESTP